MIDSRRKLAGWLLMGSLALNLLLGGYLAAGALRRPFHPPNPFAGLPTPHQLERVLPEARKPLLRSVLDEHVPAVRAAMRELFAQQQAVAAAVRAEPFDAKRLRQVLDDFTARQLDLIVAHQGTVSDLVGRLDAADRARVADLLRIPPPPKEHDGKTPPPPPQD